MDRILKKYYYNPLFPGSFSGKHNFLKELKNKGVKVSENQVDKFLAKQDPYTLFRHRLQRYRGKRQFFSPFARHVYQADLADFSQWARENGGVRYLLIIIDVYSRYLFVSPLLNKRTTTVSAAFKKIILDSGKIPNTVFIDRGGEFASREFKKVAEDIGFQLFFSANPEKASISERVIRTLREKIRRYLYYKNTKRYLPVLQRLVASYNKTKHSTTKQRPIDLIDSDPLDPTFKTIYKKESFSPVISKKPKYKIGDTVRISRLNPTFAKGHQSFTTEIFKVRGIRPHWGQYTFQLEDLRGKPIEGNFSLYELAKTTLTQKKLYRIEEILGRKRIRGIPHVLVKWIGYRDLDWIPASDLRQI